jgi:phosphoribosylaminoimidazole-succinocarboxamide synthase
VEKAQMIVRPATIFGKGIEVICRLKAVGSFFRRFGDYCTEGQDLDFLVETTLKDDERGDPPITKDQLEMLGIITGDEYEILKGLTKKITAIVKYELAEKGAELFDIKFEFGRVDGQIRLIDEISGGSMRAYKDGQSIEPLDLPAVLCLE